MSKVVCEHQRATFYAVQRFGGRKSRKLYNCPDCRTTISEETLREVRLRPRQR